MSGSPFRPDCVCGHSYADHASSRGRGLYGARRGTCTIYGCKCDEYQPAEGPPPGPRPRVSTARGHAAANGGRRRPRPQSYLDRDHHDLARDLQAEELPHG